MRRGLRSCRSETPSGVSDRESTTLTSPSASPPQSYDGVTLVFVLEPAAPAEEAERGGGDADHRPHDHPKPFVRPEAREVHVHPKDAGHERERQQRHADDGQQSEDVVLAVGEHRLVRRLETVDDLLVVVEEVPDAFSGVDDVVEVELELLGEERLDAALQYAQGRALGLDDLAVRDDLLLHVGDVAYDLL